MKSKIISYIAILTVFLVSAVCFLPFDKVTAYDNNVHITFVYQDKKFVYDQSKISFDKYDHDTIFQLAKRGFFDDAKTKADIVTQVQKMGFEIDVAVCFAVVGLDKVLGQIEDGIAYSQTDSLVTFDTKSKDVFVISDGRDGLEVDRQKLCQAVADGLKKSGSFEVQVPTNVVRAVTKQDNISKTQLKAKFSTSYANSTQNRKDNVALALSKFDGMVVESGQKVSFNEVVGKRTEQNGYKNAKVISYGKYVDGIGGGVCQASTTLYNTVLLAGLDIDEWHRHTLKSGYVKPSFDAMVNDNGADLVFTNNTDSPIYIKTECGDNGATVWIYGLQNQYQIERKSITKCTSKAKIKTVIDMDGDYADKVTYEDESFYLQTPVDGLQSEGYLVYKKDGNVVSQKLIRKDTYQTVEGVVIKGSKKRPVEEQKEQNETTGQKICQAKKENFPKWIKLHTIHPKCG